MASYGTKYRVRTRSRDGYVYRYDLRRRGYTGPVYDLFPGVEALEYELGRPGEQAFPILNASSVTCRVDVTRETSENVNLAELRRADATMWQGVLYRKEEGDLTKLWQGYVVPDTFGDSPYEPVNSVEVAAFDGLGVLKNLRYDPSGERTRLRDMILAGLSALDARQSLYTLMRWYPWLPTALTGDPLAELESDNNLWRDEAEDIFAHLHELLVQAVGTFGMELFQGADGWYAVQPYQLTRDVSLYGYDMAGGSLASVDASSLRVSADNYYIERGMRRRIHRPTQNVSVTYDFEPDLDNVILNASFEEQGDELVDPLGTYYNPKYWTCRNGEEASRESQVIRAPRDIVLGSASTEDSYLLYIEGVPTGNDLGEAEQAGHFNIPAVPRLEMRYSHTAYANRGDNVAFSVSPRSYIFCGEYCLATQIHDVVQFARKGNEATVEVEPVLDGIGTPGTVVIPEGSTLEVVDSLGSDANIARLDLSQAARVGDTELVGDLEDDVDDSFFLRIPYWESAATVDAATGIFTILTFGGDGQEMDQLSYPLYMVDPSSGGPVKGGFRVVQVGPSADSDSYGYVAIDNAKAELLVDGETIELYTWQASVQPPGGAVDISPEFRLGDGPAPGSTSGLYASDGTPTQQAADTGWKLDDPYGAVEETTGRTLPLVRARERLRLERGGLQWRMMTLLLRGGVTYAPENVLMYALEDGSGTLLMWRSYLRWQIATGRVQGEWHDLEKGSASDIYEQITQASS